MVFLYGITSIKECIFSEVYVYSHRLRTLFVAGEHCDNDTLMWARRIFDVSNIYY
jgi:hypothetical protein